ncbi:hypothetical protein ACS5PN_25700 [Roseateles sp. NT4]|uniref:hypothetical protein n=1 Tax=Roseateles sp. NT4 TaxID=3453715 RepID=UPI003EEDF8C4
MEMSTLGVAAATTAGAIAIGIIVTTWNSCCGKADSNESQAKGKVRGGKESTSSSAIKPELSQTQAKTVKDIDAPLVREPSVKKTEDDPEVRAKQHKALAQRLKALTEQVGKEIAAIRRDVDKALADSAVRLKLDDVEPDAVDVKAVQDLADAALEAANGWRVQLEGLCKTQEEDASEVSADMIDAAEENAAQDRKAPQAALERRLKELAAATEALRQVQEVRLTDTDEMKLTNRFNQKRPKVTAKLAKTFVAELSIEPEGKWSNAFEYLQALEGAGDNETAQAKASRQKPSVALAAYLQLAEPGAWASHGAYVRERANDFDGRQDKAAAVLRALAAINSADAATNQWLVRLALNGTPVETLAKYHAARADLAGVSVPGAYSAKLDELMARHGFDATVWTRLKGWAKTRPLLLSSVVAFLKTEDETTARRVAEDYYGLVAGTRPGNTEEGRIATGLTAKVIEQNKQRTVHSTATGSGHAYKYGYIGGFVRAAWELHVHENRSNLYPAWKKTSDPREYVAGRDTYNLDGALRPLLK